jgi:23S rRNA pseudouridine2605 synthase
LGSRRACEEFILQGRVTVDGKVVRELGTRVDATRHRIAVDGQTIHSERPVYYAVNKPKGYVSTNNDPSGRPRVIDLLPEIPERVFTVGRLDEASVGLMILTNDGALANRLAHPRFGVEKIYRAVVAGSPEPEVLEKLVEGVWLAEGKVRARKARVVGKQGDATVLEMVLAEGKNREVRRMLARLGHKVMSLTRVRVGPITVKGLRPGEFRRLTSEEVARLQAVAAGLPIPDESSGRKFVRPQRPGPAPRPAGGPRGGRAPIAGHEGRRPMREHRPPAATARGNAPTGPRPPRPRPPRPAHPHGEPPSRRPTRPQGEPSASRKIIGMPEAGTGRAGGDRPRPTRRRRPVEGPRRNIIKRPRRSPTPPDKAEDEA